MKVMNLLATQLGHRALVETFMATAIGIHNSVKVSAFFFFEGFVFCKIQVLFLIYFLNEYIWIQPNKHISDAYYCQAVY